MKRILIAVLLAAALLTAGVSNSGTRHETALSLSDAALAYYTDDYTPEALSALAGSASARSDEAWNSPLCAALHTLMNETRTGLLPYAETLAAFSDTDRSGGSEEPLRFYCDDFGTVNREWVWDTNRGNFYRDGAGRDLHQLRPANPQANSARGSMSFGKVRDRFPDWSVWPSDGEPVFRYVLEWNGGAGLAEPRDEIKGDVARILLYVWTAWGNANGENLNLWTDLPPSGAGLELNDGRRVIEDAETLLEWMALDPVDSWELGRNDAVQSLQGNRNVFIDYPELAFLLLGREIPDMQTPSGWARSLHCGLQAVADPPEGGQLSVSADALGGYRVTVRPSQGWTAVGWRLIPADGASVTQSGSGFTVRGLRADCTLTVTFSPEAPCANGHSWDQGTVTLTPDCETAGERRFVCAVCGAARTEPIPALGHDWHSHTVPPDCVRPGILLESCWRCGAELETPTGEAPLGHAWDQGTVTREPTQTQPGERCFRCTRCGLTRTEEIPFRFSDVTDENAYYFTAVYWALHHEPRITAGTGPTTFSPAVSCTRAQAVSFLWSACGRPEPAGDALPFSDVPSDAWFRKAVLWAVEQGITVGTAPDRFSPNRSCTRAQIVTFLWHALGDPTPEDSAPLPFTDIEADAYYRAALRWALSCGAAAGTSPTEFSPHQICTRAQAVTMLWRAFGS